MIKKGYIRTEIEKYLLDLKGDGDLSVEMVFISLPEIYKRLKADENNLIPDHITYEMFVEAAKFGLMNAEFRAKVGF